MDAFTFPCLMVVTVIATGFGIDRIDGHLLTPLVIAPIVVIVLVLERLRPERAEFRVRDESIGNELGHFLIGSELGTLAGYGAAVGLATVVAEPLQSAIGFAVWPTAWPAVAQILLALVVSDLGSYWQHRAHHRLPVLWRGHAIHHASDRLYVLKTARFHIIDFATGTFVIYAPLLLLGAPPAMIVWVSILTGVLGVLQHSNVQMPTPAWLDAIVCTPAAHWRHHSRAREDHGNFACLFTLIDRVFATFVPTAGRRPARLGLDGAPAVPVGLAAQLRYPFVRDSVRECSNQQSSVTRSTKSVTTPRSQSSAISY